MQTFLRHALAPVIAVALFGVASVVQAAEVTFDLRIERGKLPANMQRIRVKQGDAVTLRWTADRRTILHLHGYDIEKTVEPGVVAEMSFTARATGRFPVSAHVPKGSGIHTHDPPLTHIEVYPR